MGLAIKVALRHRLARLAVELHAGPSRAQQAQLALPKALGEDINDRLATGCGGGGGAGKAALALQVLQAAEQALQLPIQHRDCRRSAGRPGKREGNGIGLLGSAGLGNTGACSWLLGAPGRRPQQPIALLCASLRLLLRQPQPSPLTRHNHVLRDGRLLGGAADARGGAGPGQQLQ